MQDGSRWPITGSERFAFLEFRGTSKHDQQFTLCRLIRDSYLFQLSLLVFFYDMSSNRSNHCDLFQHATRGPQGSGEAAAPTTPHSCEPHEQTSTLYELSAKQ